MDMLIIINRPSGSVMVELWINETVLFIKIQTPLCFVLSAENE